MPRRATAVMTAATLALALAACGRAGGGEGTPIGSSSASDSAAPATTLGTSADTTAHATSAPAAEADLTLEDGWAKATTGEMTGVFGTLTNHTDRDIAVTGGTSLLAGAVEVHETVDGAMRPAAGGLVVPAGGTRELAPGADHIMLMQLSGEIEPGAHVTLTLTTKDGDPVEVDVMARSFDGGGETYHGDHTHG